MLFICNANAKGRNCCLVTCKKNQFHQSAICIWTDKENFDFRIQWDCTIYQFLFSHVKKINERLKIKIKFVEIVSGEGLVAFAYQ